MNTSAITQIHLAIDEELCEVNGLHADILAIHELAMLPDENHECSPSNISHIISSITEKSLRRIEQLKKLNNKLS